MVMVEALACGTPVIAFPEGAACELVVDGHTGFLVDDEAAMGAAVSQLGRISPAECRAWAAAHCDVDVVSRAYLQVFRDAILARSEIRAARA
jgi:glycosyltransferase involved in cell wall biosynthesis